MTAAAVLLATSDAIGVRNGIGSGVYNWVMPFQGSAHGGAARRGKTPPPEDTHEEAAYLKALGEKQKNVTVKLAGGETIRGWIEYYDKNMIRLTRDGEPNLFIFKHDILYIAEEGSARKR